MRAGIQDERPMLSIGRTRADNDHDDDKGPSINASHEFHDL